MPESSPNQPSPPPKDALPRKPRPKLPDLSGDWGASAGTRWERLAKVGRPCTAYSSQSWSNPNLETTGENQTPSNPDTKPQIKQSQITDTKGDHTEDVDVGGSFAFPGFKIDIDELDK